MNDKSRRDFVAAAAVGAASIMGWQRPSIAADSKPAADRILDAGPLTDFANDDVYDKYREDGFFIIRRDKQIFSLSSICTHKGCKVRVVDDLSFVCKCHHSTFDKDGHVTKGPAKRNLPRLAIRLSDARNVLVNLDSEVLLQD